jgi:hypothetical protein
MQLSTPIRYLFFVVYQWHDQTARARNPAILPAVVVTILLSMNILAIIQGLIFFGVTIPLLRAFPDIARLIGYICFIVVGTFVWASFIRNGVYKNFEAEFATASETRKKMRTLALSFYIALSLCLPFVVKVLLHNARKY